MLGWLRASVRTNIPAYEYEHTGIWERTYWHMSMNVPDYAYERTGI